MSAQRAPLKDQRGVTKMGRPTATLALLLEGNPLLFEEWDPAAMVVTVGVLAIVALMGSMAPALRATRVSPAIALRAE